MSTAPRPQTSPSMSSPPNGSCFQRSGLTGTTSVWPISSSDGASGFVPSMRATTLVRPGSGSNVWRSSPGPSSTWVRTSALRTSYPDSTLPSFTHWLRMSACRSSVTSPVSWSTMASTLRPPRNPVPLVIY